MKSKSFAQRLPIAIAVVLVALLAVLAVLQWQWIGEVSAMERHRMRMSLFIAGSHFTEDFDREVTRAYLYFHAEPMTPPEARLDRVLRQYDRWNAEAPYPRLVRDVFVMRRNSPKGESTLEVLWPAEHRFVACPWPPEFAALRKRWEEAALEPPSSPVARSLTVAGEIPGLVIPLTFSPPAGESPRPDPLAGVHLLVRLDQKAIVGDLFPSLTRRYFENSQGSDYALAVEAKGNPRQAVFLSDPKFPMASFGAGDLGLDMFRLRPFDELRSLRGGRSQATVRGRDQVPPPPPRPRAERPERGGRTASGERRRESGAWRLVLKHREGTLEDAVAAVRRRNLGISLGILALLGTTMGLMMVATQRMQRLARLQMEFVAGVTHELNTPLTAMRSAGQNLAAGVVADPGQVRRYGNLIESEGRRLSDLVGQALELAGIQSGRRVYHPRPVEAAEIVDGALQDCRWLLQEKHVAVEREVDAGLPLVLADAAAMRRAVQNLIENAVKYGGRAGWLGVRVRQGASGQVEITVADRGPGIRREDLPHLFKPFFRGRDAAAGGMPGNGLGLSLVSHVAEAHGGRVTVAPGEPAGSAFTLHLPAVTAAEQVQGVEEPA
ncbi:MAG TPA: HAMP domain-containing sensor histidine kinase [Thermoanaerobaculia bacterium]|nr:HAMP domain-containing sensor histidine kinase [Thermoanaerobaculia bacterium]